MNTFKDKTVIVRGGGKEKGPGYEIARAFASEGANLVIVGARKPKLEAARELEREFGVEVMALRMTQEDEDSVRLAVDGIAARFGRIDVLANCALVARAELLADLNAAELARTLDTCLVKPFLWMRACLPMLSDARGSIVSLGSIAGRSLVPGCGSLAAAVAGLEALSGIAAREWEARDVNVNVVCSRGATAQYEKWRAQFPSESETLACGQADGRFDSVGSACLFLASDEGHAVTGQIIEVSSKL